MNVSLTRPQRRNHFKEFHSSNPLVKSAFTAIDMDKQQEVQRICKEVFEDNVNLSCGIVIQLSNHYSAKLFERFQKEDREQGSEQNRMIMRLDDIMMDRPYTDTFKSFYNQCIDNRKPIKSWWCVISIIHNLRLCSMYLCKREGLDAADVLSLAIEHSLQPFLDCLVPWIVSQEGGWEDFLHGN